ncbi:MAG: type II secretion system secretin GspD [Pseudohongiellaceae bacterium]
MIKELALCAAVLFLASCAALESPPDEPVDGGDSSDGNESRAESTRATQLGNQPEPSAAELARREERQRLIEEINREGDAAGLDGYRENPPAPVQPPSNDVVELNYEQADLREVLADLADALDISIVIDPAIDEQVSVRTAQNRSLSYQDIWPLVRLLTREAGVVLEQVGNVYYARQSDLTLPMEITTPDSMGGGTASTVMQITPITHIAVPSALEILQPLLQPEGQVLRIGNSNTVSIIANESQLSRINELLQLIDDDPFRSQGIRLYELDSASATDVAEELGEVLTMIEGDSPAYQVQPLARINALLVTAPANRGFEEITRWVRLLDDADQEQAEQLFRYRVKNLNATELAATLSEVFRRDNDGESGTDSDRSEAERRRDMVREAEGEDAGEDGDANAMSVTRVAISADLRVSIVADDATNTLLIRGTPRDYRQLLATINQLDSVPLQVMINAAIAQITLTDDTAFGVDWSRVAENLGSGSATVGTSFLPSGGEDGSGGLGGLLFNRSFLDGSARIEATLEAIATNNEVRLLARPSLTVVNNMEGRIQIGSEVPVRLGETATQVGTTTNIQYRDTGITLGITPRINDDGVVNLTITQNLSSLSEGSGVDENPIFQNQEIETTVVARNGENVVLGGLIQDNNDVLNTGVPFLNRIPGLGGLFSYQRNNNERQELFIVLRPEIMDLNEPDGNNYEAISDRFLRAADMIDDSEF